LETYRARNESLLLGPAIWPSAAARRPGSQLLAGRGIANGAGMTVAVGPSFTMEARSETLLKARAYAALRSESPGVGAKFGPARKLATGFSQRASRTWSMHCLRPGRRLARAWLRHRLKDQGCIRAARPAACSSTGTITVERVQLPHGMWACGGPPTSSSANGGRRRAAPMRFRAPAAGRPHRGRPQWHRYRTRMAADGGGGRALRTGALENFR